MDSTIVREEAELTNIRQRITRIKGECDRVEAAGGAPGSLWVELANARKDEDLQMMRIERLATERMKNRRMQ